MNQQTTMTHRYTVPYRNIRDVLGLQAKVNPRREFLLSVETAEPKHGTLSYLDVAARVHQIANVFYEDLDLQRGDTICVVCDPSSADLALIELAAWLVGVAVVPVAGGRVDSGLPAALDANPSVRVIVAAEDRVEKVTAWIADRDQDYAVLKTWNTAEGYFPQVSLYEYAANRPTSFLGDDSGAKGADVPMSAGDERTARLQDVALCVLDENDSEAPLLPLTQGNLLEAAQSFAQATALSGGQRLFVSGNLMRACWHTTGLLAALLTGSSLLLARINQGGSFWRKAVAARIHVAMVEASDLRQMLAEADQAQQQGDTLFGDRINRPALKHFRFFVCLDPALDVALIRTFEERFGFPILQGYAPSHASGIATLNPITDDWASHQAARSDADGYRNLGKFVPGCTLAIVDEDGNPLRDGQEGEIRVTGPLVAGWASRTGQSGIVRTDEDGQRVLYMKALEERGQSA